MKKLFPKILIVLLAVLMAVLLVSCGKKNETPEEDKPNEYETATYTVRFNPDVKGLDYSQFDLSVESGSKISAPKFASGEAAKMTRRCARKGRKP